MNINCELQTNGDYTCVTQNELPEYITLINDGNGGTFYFFYNKRTLQFCL